jgi:hypothetical protein
MEVEGLGRKSVREREWRGVVRLSLLRGTWSGSPYVRGAPLGLDCGMGRQK